MSTNVIHARAVSIPLRCSRYRHMLIMLMAMLTLLIGHVGGAIAAGALQFPNIEQKLSSAPVTWKDAHHMTVGGVPLMAVSFLSSRAALDVASRFSAEMSVFDRVLTSPGQLILSGLNDDWHWIAVLQDVKTGSAGYVSVLSAATPIKGKTPAWIPPELSILVSLAETGSDSNHVLRLYRFAASLNTVRERIVERLAAQGWKNHTDISGAEGHDRWVRRRQELSISLFSQGHGTLMISEQKTRGAP